MVERLVCSSFFLNITKKFIGVSYTQCLPFIPNVSISSSTPKKIRERRKKKTPTETENSEIINDPPKLIFPFISTELSTCSTTDNSRIYDKNEIDSKSPTIQDASSSFITKEDSIEGRYYLFKSVNEDEQYRLPSVTTVLQATLPRSSWFGLNTWRKNQIQEHGEEQYKKMKTETIRSGTQFHQLLEEKLNSKPKKLSSLYNEVNEESQVPGAVASTTGGATGGGNTVIHKPPVVVNNNNGIDISAEDSSTPAASESLSKLTTNNDIYSESVKTVLSEIGDVMVTEGVVQHEELGYSGTVDCVAYYRGELCVIEWKTSTKPRPQIKDLYDYPLQIVAYAGAINNDVRYSFKVDKALIVVAYLTGEEAHAHVLDSDQCKLYWDKWLDRLNQFQTQFAHDLSNIHI